jgi:hypothetical protein
MSAMRREADIWAGLHHVCFVPILLQKSFWGGERKFLEPLMRFMRDDVRGHIVYPKSITDLRSGVEKRRTKSKDQLS